MRVLESSDVNLKTSHGLSSKMYLEVVKQIKNMIEDDGLHPGDKIPSERELSERLQVGRSSVREALRALELLGLIETKRGEGTFIKNFQEHKLVEILGGFFLQEKEIQDKLTEAKYWLEINCLMLAVKDASESKVDELIEWVKKTPFDDFSFFQKIAAIHNNRLMERIWTVVGSYEKSVSANVNLPAKEPYLLLLECVKKRNDMKVLETYMNDLRNLSNG